MQRTGRVNSGDVSIFYRAFGARRRTPVLLMHGANYFDSYDWIGVAEALAADREVASFDKRGFGESGWSASKDYSVDANMGDILAVIAALQWERPIVVGHSASGRLAIAFAAAFADKLSRLIVVDSGLARDEGGGGNRPATGNPPLVFESVEAAMAHFAKLALPQRASRNVWQDLAAVKCPTMIVRGLRSDRFTPELIARVSRDYPQIEWATANSQHDVADQAPQELVAAVRKFAAGV